MRFIRSRFNLWPFKKSDGYWKRTTWVGEISEADGAVIGSIVLVRNQPIQMDHKDLVSLTLDFPPIRPIPREDLDRFDLVQARLDALCVEHEFYQPAIVTMNGTREWLLYTKDGQGLMTLLVNELSGYEVQMECSQDSKWEAYRHLRRKMLRR